MNASLNWYQEGTLNTAGNCNIESWPIPCYCIVGVINTQVPGRGEREARGNGEAAEGGGKAQEAGENWGRGFAQKQANEKRATAGAAQVGDPERVVVEEFVIGITAEVSRCCSTKQRGDWLGSAIHYTMQLQLVCILDDCTNQASLLWNGSSHSETI